MIIIYKEISHSINQICSGHNCLVIPVSPHFPDGNDSAQEERRGSPDSVVPQPKDAGVAVEYRTNRLWGTADPEMSPGRRGANESMFAWARDKDSEINVLTPSQELTHKLIQNQTLNIKVTKHNLFSVRELPEFPDSK